MKLTITNNLYNLKYYLLSIIYYLLRMKENNNTKFQNMNFRQIDANIFNVRELFLFELVNVLVMYQKSLISSSTIESFHK